MSCVLEMRDVDKIWAGNIELEHFGVIKCVCYKFIYEKEGAIL
jgi:hypothetical protein